MLDWVRGLFVTHQWVDVDEELRECIVCGKAEAPDYELDDLTPGSWHTVKRGNVELHFAPRKPQPVEEAPSTPATTAPDYSAEVAPGSAS